MSSIRAEGISKSFGDVTALDGFDVTVEEGELFGLLGPNGAGKTTAISIMTGQLLPDTGEVDVLGTNPTSNPVETRRRVGILPERESPPSFMTPREYFSFVGAVRDIGEETVADRVEEWTERLAFAEKLDTLDTDLSRGQQQKVMVTATFLHEPPLVFIDEPLINLDPIIQERLKQFLTGYVDAGNTIFLSTHNVDVAEEICDRVGIVHEGRFVGERRPDTLGPGESLLDVFLEQVGASAVPRRWEGREPEIPDRHAPSGERE